MTIEIQALQRRLKLHFENYDSLRNEEIYAAYKTENRIPSTDELDYLMCQALCAMPQHASHIQLDLGWYLLRTLNKIVDASQALDPQLETIAQVVAKRNILDIDDNWFKSVLHVYELIIHKNLINIHADLKLIKELQAKQQVNSAIQKPQKNKPALLFSNKQEEQADEPCCNFVARDFTAMFF